MEKKAPRCKPRTTNRHFTFLVLTNPAKAPRHFRVPKMLCYLIGAAMLVYSVSMVYFVRNYQLMRREMDDLVRLRAEREGLIRKVNEVVSKTDKLTSEMAILSKSDTEIREALDLKPQDSKLSGGKGASEGGLDHDAQASQPENTKIVERSELSSRDLSRTRLLETENKLAELSRQIELRAQSQQEAKKAIAEKEAILAATPSIWPAQGRITSPFGYRRLQGWIREFHHGIDIAGPYNSPVVSTADGQVTFTGWKGAFGRVVIIDHGWGLTTMYGHLASTLVKPGQKVKKGQTIGRMGNTGRSTGTHLHYQVELWGKPVDPADYL